MKTPCLGAHSRSLKRTLVARTHNLGAPGARAPVRQQPCFQLTFADYWPLLCTALSGAVQDQISQYQRAHLISLMTIIIVQALPSSLPLHTCYQLQRRKDHFTIRFLRVLAGDPVKPYIRVIPDASSKLFFLPLPLSLTDRTLSDELPFTAGREKESGLERCLTCSGPSGSCVIFRTSLLATIQKKTGK